MEVRLAATRRPDLPVVMHQNWRMLTFLHWEVSVERLRPLVPAPLDLDLYDGRAYVGVIPFTVCDMRLPFTPPLPGVSRYHELNVRTYVHVRGRDPGVWFFSLDANSLAAVLGARTAFRLPYCHARMNVEASRGTGSGAGVEPSYWSDRLGFGRLPARLDAVTRPGESIGAAQPGTLEHFLVERYLLYADWRPLGMGMLVGQVHHHPYPLQRAAVRIGEIASLLRADGLPAPVGPPHTLYSPGVDVEVFRLRRTRD